MITILTFKDAQEEIEILVDNQGVSDLIDYLEYVKELTDHIHLTIDTELDRIEIPNSRIGKSLIAKHATIEFINNK